MNTMYLIVNMLVLWNLSVEVFLMKWCFQFLPCCFRNEKCMVHVSISEYFIAGKNSVLFVITGLFLVYVY